MRDCKIFCIGFAKTGTTSLSVALMTLGYNVKGVMGVHDPSISKIVYKLADKIIPLYNAFQDEPWPVLYKYLDENYGGKFILTVRNENDWIESLKRHCGDIHTPFREWIYGYGNPVGHEDVYLERYRKHNNDVMEYFKGRDDFLKMNITEGDGYEKLCPFLGHKIINEKFPHENKSKES